MSVLANLGLSVQIVTVVVPVAVYFLILGLLNSRRRPQLLTGRQDFALLIVALSPLVILPAMDFLRANPLAIAAGAVAAAAILLAPPGGTWVIYNLHAALAREVVADALKAMGMDFVVEGGGFRLPGRDIRVELNSFSLLRNVSIRLRGGSSELSRSFHEALSRRLAEISVPAHVMGVSLLLVATAMLAAPLVLLAGDVPEIVRVISDLLY